MLTLEQCTKTATARAKEIFTKDYLKANADTTYVKLGEKHRNYFELFLGIKSTDDLPYRTPVFENWIVYCIIGIDMLTGEIVFEEYELE